MERPNIEAILDRISRLSGDDYYPEQLINLIKEFNPPPKLGIAISKNLNPPNPPMTGGAIAKVHEHLIQSPNKTTV